MTRARVLFGLFLLVVACTVRQRPRYTLHLPHLTARLPNGMRVIVLPDASTDLVEVDVRYEVGANEDPPGKFGLAHLVEHLMFQQRPAGPDKPPLWQVYRQLTLMVNAGTGPDSTHYNSLARRDALGELIALEATRMELGCQTIDQEEFEREREVVRNEIRLYIGSPEGQVQYRLLQAIYPEGHPYHHDVGGDDQTLSSITLDDVCKFMSDYYVPARATMIIAGHTTAEEVKPLVDRWLASRAPRQPAPRKTVAPLDLKREQVTMEADVEETSVLVAWALPPRFSPDGYAQDFLLGAVTGRASFFGDKYEFASRVRPMVLGGEQAPVFVLEVDLPDADDVGEALDAVWRSARSAHRGLDDEQQFRDWRARVKSQFVYAFENLPARTQIYGDYAQFDPGGQFFAGELRRIDEVKPGRVRDVIRKALDPDKAVVVVVKPKKGAARYQRTGLKLGRGGADDRRDRFPVDPAEARAPLPLPEHDASIFAGARRFKLGNGMEVVLLPAESSLPVVTVDLVFRAGSAHEPPSRAGLADVAAGYLAMQDAGVGVGGELASADVLGQVGAQFDAYAGFDYTIFSARGLNVYMKPLIKGLERLIKAGDYSQEGIERYRKMFAFAMKRKAFASRQRFDAALASAIYGKDHPYAVTGDPRPDTIGHFGRDAAVDFKNQHFTAANAVLVVAGNFDAAEAERLVRANFGEWSSGHRDQPVAAPAAPRTQPTFLGVEGEDLPTVQIALAYPAPAGIDGQQAARLVLSEMLNDRLSAVREKLGATYGVYARYQPHVGPGAYSGGGQVDAQRGGEALTAMRGAFASLRGDENFEQDFARARRLVLRQLLTEVTDSRSLASRLVQMAVYALAPDYPDKLVRQVAALSPAQVKALVAAELLPEHEVVVVMGSRAAVEKTYQDAGVSDVAWVP